MLKQFLAFYFKNEFAYSNHVILLCSVQLLKDFPESYLLKIADVIEEVNIVIENIKITDLAIWFITQIRHVHEMIWTYMYCYY